MKTLLEFQKEYYEKEHAPYESVVDKYNEYFRDNAQVGDGATVCYWTDRHACTIVKRTPKTLTLRRCKATLSDDFKPDFVVGGFIAHCTNNGAQKWEYEEDEDGEIYKAHWSEKKKSFFVHGLRVVSGRHEFYDYNF